MVNEACFWQYLQLFIPLLRMARSKKITWEEHIKLEKFPGLCVVVRPAWVP